MFKRLLFGDEEKLQFKTSTTHGIARLYSHADIPRADTAYWLGFLENFDSASDVYSLLSVADVRKALIRHPENIATLVLVLTAHLEQLKNDPLFSAPPARAGKSRSSDTGDRQQETLDYASQSLANVGTRGAAALGAFLPGLASRSNSRKASSSASLASAPSAQKSRRAADRNRTREALNCCRILSRVLPIILEGDHDSTCSVAGEAGLDQGAALASSDFEMSLLWTPVDDAVLIGEQATPFRTRASRSSPDTSATEDEQFVIAESDDEDGADFAPRRTKPSSPSDPLARAARQTQERLNATLQRDTSVGIRLTRTIVDLLFYAGFTIPWPEEASHLDDEGATIAASRIHYIIWERGVGSSVDLVGRTGAHDAHRVEILRLLLVLVSKSIYVHAHAQQFSDNLPLRYIAQDLGKNITLPLLCSLLNISVAAPKTESWLSDLASLPVGLVRDQTKSGQDSRRATATLALELLNIVCGYELPAEDGNSAAGVMQENLRPPYGTPQRRPQMLPTASTTSIADSESGRAKTPNLFRVYLGKLHRQSDFRLLADGIFNILEEKASPVAFLGAVTGTADPVESSTTGRTVPDAIILLWRLIWQNAKFRAYVLEDRSPQLLALLLSHALHNKDNVARQGLVRLVAFVLQDVSSERAFAVNICKAGSGVKTRISGAQKWGIASGGIGAPITAVGNGAGGSSTSAQVATGADVLIQGVYALIATTKSSLSALYPPLVITLTNISPYLRNLSILSSNRLVALFRSFTSPAFLLADEGNPRLVYYLIECLNHIITFGFQRNANFVYALVRNYHVVEKLANFTLRRGIADIRRAHRRAGLAITEDTPLFTPRNEQATDPIALAQPEKSEQRAAMSTHAPTPLLNSLAIDEEAPASEKARGKMRRMSTSSEANNTGAHGGVEAQNVGEGAGEDEEERLVNGFTDEELYYAASTVGRNGFVPGQDWVTSWHKGLPLDTLQLTMLELVPKVQDLCANIASKSDADERVLAFLREQNLDGILPPAPAHIQPRAFKWTPQVSIWLLSYIWGLVYTATSLPYGLFNGTCARLFQIRTHDAPTATRLASSAAGRTRSRSGTGDSSVGQGARTSSSALGSPRLLASTDSAALASVGTMVLGSLSHVLGMGGQSTASGSQAAPPLRGQADPQRTSASV